jgi:hypothetical protein
MVHGELTEQSFIPRMITCRCGRRRGRVENENGVFTDAVRVQPDEWR